MAESTLNKSNKKSDVEDNNIIAQRFLNIFRQLHVFTPERKQAFDDLILSQPPEIRGMFGKLLGGSALQEYVNELEQKSGLSREQSGASEGNESDILNRAIENSSSQEQPLSSNVLNNSQIQAQLLEMMSKVSHSAPAAFDTKDLEALVAKLMRSQSELLANITSKQTEQLSKIITLSLQESYRSSTRSFIEAIREMNHESINAIRETLNYQNNKPIILSNYINNSNPTQVNNNNIEQQANFQQPKNMPSENIAHTQNHQQQLQDLETYAERQNKDFDFDGSGSKKKKKKKKNKRDNFISDITNSTATDTFLDDTFEDDLLSSDTNDFDSSGYEKELNLKGLDYSLFGDPHEKVSYPSMNFSSDLLAKEVEEPLKDDDDQNYVYEEHYVDVEPKIEEKKETRENLKDKILSKAKKLIKGGNSDHLNFDINSIDDIILDPEIEEENALKPLAETDTISIKSESPSIDDASQNEEWEWVEETEEDGSEKTDDVAFDSTNKEKNATQTYIHEDDDFINIGEENLPVGENEDEEWEWVEETEEADNAEEIEKDKPEASAKENEWVWEYDDSDTPEGEEDWVWEYEELPETEKSAVDEEPIAFEEEYYEPEGKPEEKTNPFSSKGLLEQESLFKFNEENKNLKVKETKTEIEKAPLFSKENIIPEQKANAAPSEEGLDRTLEPLETPGNEILVNIGDLSSISLDKKKEAIVEDMENINDNFLYSSTTEESDNLDDVYNK